MAAVDKATRDRAVALFNTGGISSNEIAEELGVSSRSVKRWRKEWKADRRGVEVPRAPAPARKGNPQEAQPRKPPPPDEAEDAVSYWRRKESESSATAQLAKGKGRESAAAQWERIAHVCRMEYQKALLSHAEEQDRKARSLQRDPRELARRVLRQLPVLLRACPEMAAEVRAQIDAVIPRE